MPTSAEVGLPDVNVTAWYGLYAPAGTPKPIVDRLSDALQSVTRSQAFVDSLAKMENNAYTTPPTQGRPRCTRRSPRRSISGRRSCGRRASSRSDRR